MTGDALEQLRSAGLLVDSLKFGKLERCDTEHAKRGKRDGWYVAHEFRRDNGEIIVVGCYGDWKRFGDELFRFERSQRGWSDAERRRLEAERERIAQQAEQERQRRNAECARRSVKILSGLPDSGKSDYLKDKGVGSYGLKFANGSAVVPVSSFSRAADGSISSVLVGLQFIDADGSKRFLTGTAKQSAMHLIGDTASEPKRVFIAEGYATAATIHKVTGAVVAVAFDAGNLLPVGRAIVALFPKAQIVFAADNDAATPGNPGVNKAREAAATVGGRVVIPDFSALQGDAAGLTDWNDLQNAVSATEVATQIKAQLAPRSTKKRTPPRQAAPNPPVSPPAIPPADSSAALPESLNRFEVRNGWLYRVGGKSGNEGLVAICAEIKVAAHGRTRDGLGWSLLLQFRDRDNAEKQLWVLRSQISSDGGRLVIAALLDHGLELLSGRDRKAWLIEYLENSRPALTATLTEVIGWNDGVFVLPDRVIGPCDSARPLMFKSDAPMQSACSQSGTVAEWRDSVGVHCMNSTRLAAAVSAAFAAPLLDILGTDTFGLHFVGDSSVGKTTVLVVTASVCGDPRHYMQTWRATANSFESLARSHNYLPLVLDELGQVEPRELGDVIYMLSQGQGKRRANESGTGRSLEAKWRLIFISSGEKTVADILALAGKKPTPGQDVRMISIPASPHDDAATSKALGIFETIGEFGSGAGLSDYLKSQAQRFHGQALLAFIERLATADRRALADRIHKGRERFKADNVPVSASGQVSRVADSFALVAVAGELASEAGITGWPKGFATAAVRDCFRSWALLRGGFESLELRQAFEHVCRALAIHGEINFTRWESETASTDTHQPRTAQRWGFKRVEKDLDTTRAVFYLTADGFRALCEPHDARRVAQLLKSMDVLETDKEPHRLTKKVRLPDAGSKPVNTYVINYEALLQARARDLSTVKDQLPDLDQDVPF